MRSLLLNGVLLGLPCTLHRNRAAAGPGDAGRFYDHHDLANMGGTENPEENIYWSRCGSFPDASRPDGYCAKLSFDAAGREAEFGMGNNRVFLQKLDENAEGIRLQVNPRGFNTRFTADLKLSDGQLIRTAYVPASGDGWREIFLPFPKEEIAGRPSLLRLPAGGVVSGRPEGRSSSTMSRDGFKKLPEDLAPLTAEPVYRKLAGRPANR